MADLLDKFPPAVKSLWNLERELRSALQNTILLRKAEAGKHMDSAKGHLEQALKELRLQRTERPTSPDIPPAKDDKLGYGEGPREQYGEGYRHRSEELTEGADESNEHGWAGGSSDTTAPIPDTKPKH